MKASSALLFANNVFATGRKYVGEPLGEKISVSFVKNLFSAPITLMVTRYGISAR